MYPTIVDSGYVNSKSQEVALVGRRSRNRNMQRVSYSGTALVRLARVAVQLSCAGTFADSSGEFCALLIYSSSFHKSTIKKSKEREELQ